MTSEQSDRLLEKRKELQLHIRFNEFVKANVMPFFEILNEFQNSKIEYRALSFRRVPQELQELLREYIQSQACSSYKLSEAEISLGDEAVERLMERYPNTHPLRYIPDLPRYHFWWQVEEQIKKHQLEEQEVYLCYLQYALVFKVKISELIIKATEEVFTAWYGDLVVFPADYHWLLVHSVNDFWQFGNKHTFSSITE